MSRTLILAASVIAVTSGIALADRIDDRQASQAASIREGIRSGELTRREVLELRAEQARITDLERRAKADGVVTRREAAVIEHAQNRAARHIYREKHDSERAWWRRWY